MVRELFERRGDLAVYDTREVRADYCEFVVHSKDIPAWLSLLETEFGPPSKPEGSKPTSEQQKLTEKFGGIKKDQTLFVKVHQGRASIALLWPWNNGEQVTVKMIEAVPAAAGVEDLASAVESVRTPRRVPRAVIWCAVGLVVAVAGGGAYFAVQVRELERRLRAMVIEDVDPRLVPDGVYEGECDLGLVSAKVKVLVQGGRIEGVSLVEHRHGPGYGAEPITERIVARQSLRVDAVSGATGSGTVIRKAVELALKPAEGSARPAADSSAGAGAGAPQAADTAR